MWIAKFATWNNHAMCTLATCVHKVLANIHINQDVSCLLATLPTYAQHFYRDLLARDHDQQVKIPKVQPIGWPWCWQWHSNGCSAWTVPQEAVLVEQAPCQHNSGDCITCSTRWCSSHEGFVQVGQQWECMQEHFQRLDEGKYAKYLCSKTIYGDYSHHLAQNKTCCTCGAYSSSSIWNYCMDAVQWQV